MPTTPGAQPADAPRLGAWARAGRLVGLVAACDERTVTLFDPGDRQVARVGREQVQALPAGAVTVTVTVDLPLAHGVPEETLRRWVASLTDPVLGGRARAALADGGLDEGAALPPTRLDVRAAATSGAVCLCGARTPAAAGVSLACGQCGRLAVSPPGAGRR